MGPISTASGTLMGALEWLGQLDAALGETWQGIHAGFSGLIFLGLAGGVIGFSRRRRDLFSGFHVGWGFAFFLGLSGLLMLLTPLAQDPVRAWMRGGQVLAAPVALALMVAFLLRIRSLEESEETEAREATVQWQLRQAQQRLEGLQAENAKLANERDRANQDAQRLVQERDAANRDAREARIREEDTGLYTRHHFTERLREEFERCHRQGYLPLPLFIGLQGIDELDEEEREKVINRAGQTLQDDLRLPDLACRFGSSEFLVIPCDTDAKGTGALAKRLHRQLKRGAGRAGGAGHTGLAFAFVVMEFPVHLQQFDDYLEACNQATSQIRHQPSNRLVRLPASFSPGTWPHPV